MRENLIVVRAGDASLHRRWINDSRARKFDLLVSYYGRIAGRYERQADHYHAMTGPRWPAHDWLLSHRSDLFERYANVAFVCDDVDADTRAWNMMFDLAAWFGLDLAQPAVVGHVNHPIVLPASGTLLRYTSFVEVMCPVFSRRALARCADTFGASVSGWGLDALWSARLPYPEYRIAVVDRVRVTHTSPTRGGALRPVLDALGVDPPAEAAALLARAGVSFPAAVEHARLALG